MDRHGMKNVLFATGLAGVLVAAGAVTSYARPSSESGNSRNGKITICHSTGQGFVAITISDNGKAHRNHRNDQFQVPPGGCPETDVVLPDGGATSGAGGSVRGGSGSSDGSSSGGVVGGSDSATGINSGGLNRSGANASSGSAANAGGITGAGGVPVLTQADNIPSPPTAGNVPVANPEPVTMLLFGAGLAGVGYVARRRRKAEQ